jgi:hypothetical protein
MEKTIKISTDKEIVYIVSISQIERVYHDMRSEGEIKKLQKKDILEVFDLMRCPEFIDDEIRSCLQNLADSR